MTVRDILVGSGYMLHGRVYQFKGDSGLEKEIRLNGYKTSWKVSFNMPKLAYLAIFYGFFHGMNKINISFMEVLMLRKSYIIENFAGYFKMPFFGARL